MFRKTLPLMIATVALLLPTGLGAVDGEEPEGDEVERVKDEIRATLGEVPVFLEVFPESGLAGGWAEIAGIQLSPDTALSAKEKELIGLAVAAQIPCDYCVYFHTEVAKANGATDQEVAEAIAMAAITRHWSTVLNGSQIDSETFRAQTDRILAFVERQAESE